MKKRCTNSACRKMFISDAICPYCGKEYPRIPSIGDYEVYLVNSGTDKAKTAFAIWHLDMNLRMLELLKMVENCPCVISKGLTRKEAMLWRKALHKVGASAKIQYRQ